MLIIFGLIFRKKISYLCLIFIRLPFLGLGFYVKYDINREIYLYLGQWNFLNVWIDEIFQPRYFHQVILYLPIYQFLTVYSTIDVYSGFILNFPRSSLNVSFESLQIWG